MGGVSSTADKVLVYNNRYRLQKMGIDENVQQEIIGMVDSLLRILKKETNADAARVKMEDFIRQRESSLSPQSKKVAKKLGDSRK